MTKYSSLILIFIFSLLVTGTTSADAFRDSLEKGSMGDTRLVINLASKHVGSEGVWFKGEFTAFNESNYGIGLEQDINRAGTVSLVGGLYDDSFTTTAFYAGAAGRKWLNKNVALGVTGAFASSKGYNERGYSRFGLVPIFAGVLTLTTGTYGVNLSYTPVGLISKEVDGIYALQLTMKIK